MSIESVVAARIHPSIGIARVGNSNEFFIGPELPHPSSPPGGYRDAQGRLKRQAARFRIYGYDKDGKVVAELTAATAAIQWTVNVANKKAAWYNFDAALDLAEAAGLRSARRNSAVQGKDREKLVIDPGERTISGASQPPIAFDTGKFFDQPVYLGEISTDDAGRLIFVGGMGKSESPFPGYNLVTFANNPGWHDDTSDGPVCATVSIAGRSIPVEPAWVVTTPPNYSPDLVTPQTMHDVIRDACMGSMIKAPAKPSFTYDILPLFRQFHEAQWVNNGFFVQFGWNGPNDFLRADVLKKLSTLPMSSTDDPYGEMRRQIFYSFRNPGGTVFEPLKWPPLYGDAFGSFDSPPGPHVGFSITPTLYGFLQQWMEGDFIADYNPNAKDAVSFDDIALADQPEALDRAALHFCMGGPFHPGCEMTWPMRRSSMYQSPFRLRHRLGGSDLDYGEFLTQAAILSDDGPLSASGPGDITKWMAVPWQSDTASCRAGYPGTEFPDDTFIPTFWPSRVPNTVLTEHDFNTVVDASQPLEIRMAAFYSRKIWLRSLGLKSPYLEQISRMVDHFGELGLIEKRDVPQPDANFPAVMYVETLAMHPPQLMGSISTAETAHEPEGVGVTLDFARARFGGLRRVRRKADTSVITEDSI